VPTGLNYPFATPASRPLWVLPDTLNVLEVVQDRTLVSRTDSGIQIKFIESLDKTRNCSGRASSPAFVDAKCVFRPENPTIRTQNSQRCFMGSNPWSTCRYETTTTAYHTGRTVAKYRVDRSRNCWMANRDFGGSVVRYDGSDGRWPTRAHVGVIDDRCGRRPDCDIHRVTGSDSGWTLGKPPFRDHARRRRRSVSCHSRWVFCSVDCCRVCRSDWYYRLLVLVRGIRYR